MKWPFVRRSKYDELMFDFKIVNDERNIFLKEVNDLNRETTRLNQELSKELNSHRETKNLWKKSQEHADSFLEQIRILKKELQETKDVLKIAKEELDETKDDLECEIDISKTFIASTNLYMSKCSDAKKEISKVRSILKKIAKDL